MKIAIGADHRGEDVRHHLAVALREQGHQIIESSPPAATSNGAATNGAVCDYPDQAWPVAQAVASGEADRGILICGSGIGMSIAANKVAGCRAALVHDEVAAEMSRRHNDANVLCLASDMLNGRGVDRIVAVWLGTAFEGGRHARRVAKVAAIENDIDPTTVTDETPVG